MRVCGFATMSSVRIAWVGALVVAILAVCALASGAEAGINAWTTTGPLGGWILLAADPTTPGRVFVGREGALFRSTDDTSTWVRIDVAPDPATPSLRPTAMAWDPAAKNTIYASFGGSALSQSLDSGVTWARHGASVPCCPSGAIGFDRIAVSTGSVRRLHALVSGGGLYSSVDDASTWAPSTSGPGNDFALDPFRPDSIYFAPVGGGQFLRSDDGGTTWMQVATGLDLGLHLTAVAADPSQDGRVYAAGDIFGGSDPAAIYVSNDRGVRWSKLGVLSDNVPSFVRELHVDSAHPNTLIALSAQNVLRSDDGSVTWRVLDVRPSFIYGLGGGQSTALAIGQSFDELYVGTSTGGIARTIDAGATWERRNAGLPGDRVTELAGAANPQFEMGAIARSLWFGTSTLYLRTAAHNLWFDLHGYSPLAAPLFPFRLSAVVATTPPDTAPAPAFFVLGDADRIARSNSSGLWDELEPLPPANYDKLVATSSLSATLYAAGRVVTTQFLQTPGGLAVSLDGGQTWVDRRAALVAASGGSLGVATLDVTALGFDAQRPAGVWVGVGPQLFESRDSGASWTLVANLSGQRIDAIAIDPGDTQHLVVVGHLDARVQESFDGGASWMRLDSGLAYSGELRALVVDWLAQPRAIHVGTAAGVYVKAASSQWSLMPGSGALAVNALVVARPPQVVDRMTLLAGTDTGVHEYTADPTGQFVAVYRFFNTATVTHFYTAFATERDYVLAHYPTFQDEGIAFWALEHEAPRARPVWRFFNTATGTHFFTNLDQERASLEASHPEFVFEGIGWYVFDASEPGTVPGWQFYNSVSGAHFYTTSDDEVIYIGHHFPQFVPQGIHFGVYPAVPRD